MILLKKYFRKKNTEFFQVWKDDDVVIYKLRQKSEDNQNEFSEWYEVFRRTVKQADIYHSEEYEKYPSDEAFGSWAWSCANLKVLEKVLLNHFQCDVSLILTYLGFYD